jgi:hypothetical protein
MKKLFVLLLSLVVVGGIFAQATVNGYVRAISTFTDGNVAYADRLRLNLNFKTEDGNVQMFTRLQGASTIAPTPQYMWGSVKLLDGKAKITGGYLGNWDYEFCSGISDYLFGNVCNDDDYIDQVKGMMFEVFPVDALAIAAVFTPAADFSAGDLYFAAKYAVEGVGTAVLDTDLDDESDSNVFRAAFQYTGVKDLSATAGYKYLKDAGSAFGIIDYAMGPLSVEAAPEYFLGDNGGLYLEGYVSYKVTDAFQINLVGAYDENSVYLATKAKDATYKIDKTGAIVVDTAAVAATASTYKFGAEFRYTIGKALLEADFYYDEVAEWSIPLSVRVNF